MYEFLRIACRYVRCCAEESNTADTPVFNEKQAAWECEDEEDSVDMAITNSERQDNSRTKASSMWMEQRQRMHPIGLTSCILFPNVAWPST